MSQDANQNVERAFGSGRYVVRRLLGDGSSRRVWLCRDALLPRDVAVAMTKAGARDRYPRAAVQQELRVMGLLGNHRHIVSLYDTGDDGGQPFLAMRYMPGGSVKQLLELEGRSLSLDQAVNIAIDVCRALEHAHSMGVIHRDIKPSHIWLEADGSAALGDFSVALAPGEQPDRRDGAIRGTVAYMSPEHVLGKPDSPASDIYSLGAVLYHLVAGTSPFVGPTAASIMSQHLDVQPTAPSVLCPGLPAAFDELILRMLAKNPDDRPHGATDVRRALERLGAAAPTDSGGEVHVAAQLDNEDFVGRSFELGELRQALADARAGRGRLVLLKGEPGIGKTRTAEMFARIAQDEGAQVRWGRCNEWDTAPPFWPWIQIIRQHVEEGELPDLREELGAGVSEIAQIVPQIPLEVGDVPAPPELSPDQARFRLFDSVASFIVRAARRRPLVLILDDVHWADRPSLLLLTFLARQMRHARLVVVAAFREGQLGPDHPLLQALSDVSREDTVLHVAIGPMDDSDVARFIERMIGAQPRPSVARAIYRETEGNPFFVKELVRLLASEHRLHDLDASKGFPIPESVRDVLRRRLEHLSDRCHEMLEIASAVGRDFDLALVIAVSSGDASDVRIALQEAMRDHIVLSKDASERYSFAHALMRETLYEDLLPARRGALHTRIGAVIEETCTHQIDAHLSELAQHFYRSADDSVRARGAQYAERAAQLSMRTLAFEEASRLYVMALEGAADGVERCELMLALGEARIRSGETESGKVAFANAVDLARRLHRPQLVARAALGYGGIGFQAGAVDEVLVGFLRQALERLDGTADPLKARLLCRLGRELYFTDREAERLQLVRDGVAIARRLGDNPTLAYALHALHFVLSGAAGGRPELIGERIHVAGEIVALANADGDVEMALQGHHRRIRDLLELGDISSVRGEIDTYTRIADDLRQPHYVWQARGFQIMLMLLAGRFDEAERATAQMMSIGRHAQTPNALQAFGVQIGTIRREQGRMGELEAATRQFAATFPAVPAWRAGLAFICLEAGDLDAAALEFQALAGRDFIDLPRDAQYVPALMHLAQVSVALADDRRTRMLYELLLPFAGRTVVVGDAFSCYGAADYFLGVLASALRQQKAAVEHFEGALRINASMGAVLFHAYAEIDYAALLLEIGDEDGRQRALALLESAISTARGLHASRLLESAIDLKLRTQSIDRFDIWGSIHAVVDAARRDRPDIRSHVVAGGPITILFTDIEGSTEINDRIGDVAWMVVLRRHNAIIRNEITRQDGFEVKSQGDGFMIVFADAQMAVRCACGIQQAFERDRQLHPEMPLRVRVGMHTGEVIEEGDDFFGTNVVIAARIESVARGGEILVSEQTRVLTSALPGILFQQMDARKLKGFQEARAIYRVTEAPVNATAR